jgi:hypothetical protein
VLLCGLSLSDLFLCTLALPVFSLAQIQQFIPGIFFHPTMPQPNAFPFFFIFYSFFRNGPRIEQSSVGFLLSPLFDGTNHVGLDVGCDHN